MNALQRLATKHPLVFGLLVTLMVLVFYITAALVAEIIATNRAGYELVEALGRAVASLIFLYMLWSFGWFGPAGVTKRGTLQAWLYLLMVLAYDLVTTLYALFDGVATFGISDPALSASVATNALTTGLIEEIPFRGIILCAFVRLWGTSRRGVVKSAIYSSLLFGGSHLFHILLGRPIPQAMLVAVSTFLSGIVYASFVLRSKTIWTVVAWHGLVNAVVAMRVLEAPGFTETVPTLNLMILLQLPLVVYGAYLIYKVSPKLVVVEGGTGRAQEVWP